MILVFLMVAGVLQSVAPAAADGTGNVAPSPASTIYVTNRFESDGGLSKVTWDGLDPASATVDGDFVRIPDGGGVDSAIFDHHGKLVASLTDRHLLTVIDPATRAIVTPRLNIDDLPYPADLALDPHSDTIWVTSYASGGPFAVATVDEDTGAVVDKNPDNIDVLGGIAFDAAGSRLFVSSQAGTVYEINPADGRIIRSTSAPGNPDGMTFDPYSGHLFASGCGGLCQFDVGTPAAPTLTLMDVVGEPGGDGIAADGVGHIFIGGNGLQMFDEASGTTVLISSAVPGNDDVVPLIGAGGPPTSDLTGTGTPVHAVEGARFDGRVATFTASDRSAVASDFTAVVRWGDGTSSAGVVTGADGSFAVAGTHTYEEEGSVRVAVLITRTSTGAVGSADSTATIDDAPLTASCAARRSSALTYSGVLATFTDADPGGAVADYTATIDWGDGATSTGLVSAAGNGKFAVNGIHVYPTLDELTPYPVKVTVRDAGGSVGGTPTCSVDVGRGMFVIGDGVATVGNQVTFWGTGWDKANPRSACATLYAPDFAGFAISSGSSTSATWQSAIGLGAWRTPAGNSPPPPAGPLPSTIAAQVTNCVTRNGAIVSGNTIRTVLIQPVSDYSPDPASAGVGIVLPDATLTPPAFTADSPPSTATVDAEYTYRLEATGTPDPMFSVATGALPDGVTLDPVTGALQGIPSKAGTFTFRLRAANSLVPDAVSPQRTVVVEPAPAPPVFTAATPGGSVAVGQQYTYTFAATGHPTPTFAVIRGALPPGLGLDPVTGVLTGKPTAEGTFIFAIGATNGVAPDAESPDVAIVVLPAQPDFTAATPPATGTVGRSYTSFTFLATGAPPPSFSLASGELPPGLRLYGGVLSGTPTSAGLYTFTVRASNGLAPDAVTPPLTIDVSAAPVFTAANPPRAATVGFPYSFGFVAAARPAPSYTVASGSLPDGLDLDQVTGVLSGTPLVGGSFTFAVRASNGIAPDATTTPITVTVAAAPEAPSFLADTPPDTATVGQFYSYQYLVGGTPAPLMGLASGSLPPGVTLNPATGRVSGNPTTPGTYTFTISAANGVPPDAVSNPATVVVAPAPAAPAFSAASPPVSGRVGDPYSYTFVATGTPTPTFRQWSGVLPSGVTIDQATGVLSGTPDMPGIFTFTIAAENGVLPAAISAPITITVTAPAGPPIAVDQTFSVASGTQLDVPAPGLLVGTQGSDPRFKLSVLVANDFARGTVVLRADGSFSYVPAPGFTGDDTFTYLARDNNGVSTPATVTVTVTPGGPPSATVNAISPPSGTAVTGPVAVGATLTPPAGQTITSWTVSYRRPGDASLVQIAAGTGSNVAATFDPTVVRNGTYALFIRAVASGGGVTTTESGVIVDGEYKPGRYSTTFSDMKFAVGSIPIDLQRTYDSIDRTSGDFGRGWNLDVGNFRVDTNGPLGRGAWSSYDCTDSIFQTKTCYRSAAPHVATVTWPDGHLEKFDLTPTPALGGFGFPSPPTAAFTAQAGSTSSLRAAPDGLTFADPDLHLYGGLLVGDMGMFDPTLFVLTDKGGTQYTIDRRVGLLSIEDPNGNIVRLDDTGVRPDTGPAIATYGRDEQNRVARIVGPTGNIDYTYSPAGDLVGVHYPNGATQAFTYDAQHNLLTTSGGGVTVRSLQYDAAGRLISVTDGNGHTSTITSNVAGHQQVITDPTGQLTTVNTFSDRGDLIQQDRTFSGKTITTKATFDAVGRELSTTDGLGHTVSQTWDAGGNVLTQTDALGHTTTYSYNALGEPLTITDPLGHVTTNTYDDRGNKLTQVEPDGGTTTSSYDTSGHLLTSTDPVGRTTTRTYDAAGHLASVADPGGHVTHQTVDPATGRVFSLTDPLDATTTFGYDADGNLTSLTDAKGHTRTATYDSFDRVTSLTDPVGAVEHRTYDPAGNLVSRLDRNGATTTYGYDARSQLTSEDVPGAGTTTYSYDPIGRLTSATNATAQLAFTYDDADHVLTSGTTGVVGSSMPTSTIAHTYDAAGNVTSTQGPGGTTGYAYDARSVLASITDSVGGTFALGYDPAGRLASMTRPNGITDSIVRNAAGDLTSLRSKIGASVVNQADYTYDATGLRNSITTTGGTTSYGYDAASQLTSATAPGLSAETFTYDPVGNRTSTTTAALGSFAYNDADRLTSDSTANYVYDGEGNLISRALKANGALTTYSWTADHELVGITYPDSTTSVFRYDPLGRRVVVADGTAVKRYVFDRQSLVGEYDGSNTLVATYVHLGNDPTRTLEMTRGGQRYFYLADAQGSTKVLTTLAGGIANSYAYNAFGTPTVTGAIDNPFTFTGQMYDAKAGLLLFPLRADDPAGGRFLSEDPQPALNPYPYALNNPLNLSDPTGASASAEGTVVLIVSMTAAGIKALHAVSQDNECGAVFDAAALTAFYHAFILGFIFGPWGMAAGEIGGILLETGGALKCHH